jgi:hypothetical protein
MLNRERADIRNMSIETNEQSRAEWLEHGYLIDERLGMMCGAGKPSERQIQIAKIQADAWAAKQRKAKAE